MTRDVQNLYSQVWSECVNRLSHRLSQQEIQRFIKPLRFLPGEDIRLGAENTYICGIVNNRYKPIIEREMQAVLNGGHLPCISVEIIEKDHPAFDSRRAGVLDGSQSGEGTRFTYSPPLQKYPLQQPRIAQNDLDAESLPPQASAPAMGHWPEDPCPQAPVARPDVDLERLDKIRKSCLNPDYTFDAFVQGEGNKMAYGSALEVSQDLGRHNPLLFYGASGLGKTHLMHAIGNQILARDPSAKVLLITSEVFVNQYIYASRHRELDAFRLYMRSMDVLLIDDIQFFAGKQGSERELFNTINAMLDARAQLVMTSDQYPREIKTLEQRLVTRLGHGLVWLLEPPDLETRALILKSKAKAQRIHLDDACAQLIARIIQSNVRELEGALHRVIAQAEFLGSQITDTLIKDALKDLIKIHSAACTIDNIQQAVCGYYQIRHQDLVGKVRKREIARPRQMAMFLCKRLTSHSLPEIAAEFGGRNHSTVLHACKQMDKLIAHDSHAEDEYRALNRLLQ
jgi:chromosomal replication initiator protein